MVRSSRSALIPGFMFLALILALAMVLQQPLWGAAAKLPSSAAPTPVAGESWLSHLHRSFDETSMGKTGRLGPPNDIPVKQPHSFAASPGERVTLRGADLYRLNCQACHGAEGTGAPPEINSVINPVRATSTAAIIEQMKARGMEMRRADADTLARQSKTMLLDRLHHGGQDMPAFPHLRPDELDALVAYLRLLAGVPGAEREQRSVQESRVQAGEHIVKSTCNICHAAAGPNPNPEQLYQGAFPPLSTLTQRMSEAQFRRKVTQGAAVWMGAPAEFSRGRMPVFYYLSEEEAADAYLYLSKYPPQQFAPLDATAVPMAGDDDGRPGPELIGVSYPAAADKAQQQEANSSRAKLVALVALAGLAAIPIIAIGIGFTIMEMRRLANEPRRSKRSSSRYRHNKYNPQVQPPCGEDGELVA